jgi:hypothetical protein
MNPVVKYYVSQASRGNGRGDSSGIGPIYSIAHFVQRGQGIGSLLSGLFRIVRRVLWSGAKTVGGQTFKALRREALRTGGKILQDIAENPQVSSHDIIPNTSANLLRISSRSYGEEGGELVNLSGHPVPKKKRKSSKRAKTTKRYIFS